MLCLRTPTIGAAVLMASLIASCGKKSSSNDGEKTDGDHGDDGNHEDLDALRKDAYQGVYKVDSQVDTKYMACDEEEPVTGMGQMSYFKLDTVFEFTMDPASAPLLDLWLSPCSSAQACEGPAANFLFPDKNASEWGGVTSRSIGNAVFSPGKCSFQYTERTAVLRDHALDIVSRSYSGEVDALGNGICAQSSGGDTPIDSYYDTYRNKIACAHRETIKATKLDVPLPE